MRPSVPALAATLVTVPAIAQVTAESELSTSVAEVNQPFTLTLSVMTDETSPMPHSPALPSPAGMTVRGPSVGTKQQVSIAGGRVETRRGLSATWTLVASRPGTYTLGPPRAQVGSRTVNAPPRAIQIVPAGRGPRSAAPPTLDPFDVFRGLPGFGLPGLGRGTDLDEFESLPAGPEELRMARALDPVAFLRVEVDPRRPVVGEQVTLSVYAYGSRGPFREVNSSEPSRADFLSYPILESSATERLERVTIDGSVWFATKVREVALFPLRSGALTIGAFRMGFAGRGYPAASPHLGLVRESQPVVVEVSEPPARGRPPGYRLGDVGQFSLSAKVEPREVTQGESISVLVTLEGTGNLPHRLDVPARHGVEWLEPSVNDEIGNRGTRIGGWRKFGYVVRVDAAGTVDLGDLALPYWDPTRDAYDVARAVLGAVEATPNPKATARAATPRDDALATLTAPRDELGPPARVPRRWADAWWFWIALGAGPAGVIGGGLAARGARRLRSRWAERAGSIRQASHDALRSARGARDGAAAAPHVERALHAAIEATFGLRSRGWLRNDLVARLVDAGLPRPDAEAARALLDDCDAVRFTGAAGEPADLAERASDLVAAIEAARPRRQP